MRRIAGIEDEWRRAAEIVLATHVEADAMTSINWPDWADRIVQTYRGYCEFVGWSYRGDECGGWGYLMDVADGFTPPDDWATKPLKQCVIYRQRPGLESLRVPQTPTTGVNAIVGHWPEETGEEIE